MFSTDSMTDEDKQVQCVELLCEDNMPCRFTEEELDEVIRHSEASGSASPEDVRAFWAKWGH